jgi:hypothetical protein
MNENVRLGFLFCLVIFATLSSLVFYFYNKRSSYTDESLVNACDYFSLFDANSDNACYQYCYDVLKKHLNDPLICTSISFKSSYAQILSTFQQTILKCSSRCAREADEAELILQAHAYLDSASTGGAHCGDR